MGRPNAQPFNSEPNTGRMGYRTEYDAPDERPMLYMAHPFWEDETERLTYEDAVEADRPRDDDSLLSYLARISAAVEGRYKGVLPKMRRPGLSRTDRERQLQKLRGQIGSKTEVL